MGTHLTAIDCIFLSHALFNESMARFGHHRNTTSLFNNINCIPAKAWVMNDSCSWIFLQEGGSQQADNIVAFDEIPFIIEKETAIEVTIKGNPHICLMRNNRVCCILATFRQQRIRYTVREVTIGNMMHFNELNVDARNLETRFYGINDMACCTIS
ncbi:Uncharacterised protein [Klebsiella quasipneumoniae]|nr:Uncharacterised protein [Klebsiella quasipneumoniae]